jgi:NitT/TauT family transport system permease protein
MESILEKTNEISIKEKTKKNIKNIVVYFSPILIGGLALFLNLFIPDENSFIVSYYYATFLIVLTGMLIILGILGLWVKKIFSKIVELAPLISVALVFLIVLDLVAAKFGLLPKPFYPGPDKILSSIVKDWKLLSISFLYSLRLLFVGYGIGASLGLLSGIAMGWNKNVSYWLMPLVKVIGPIPATAWIPIAMTLFPTSFTASIFLIVLAVWFPVTVLTSSGVANVPNAYFEVAKTLGAKRNYLIFKVAVPAAAPMIFIGLFSGLGVSFVTLVVAEMLGVKAGVGWYISWAQGWAEYAKVWGALLIMAILFSGLISLLFKIKDKVLIWQKGLIKW